MKINFCQIVVRVVSGPDCLTGKMAVIFLFLAGTVFQCHAGEANYREYLVGTRAAGMGGAVCADATSVDACYYNPAGLARTEKNSISVSANVYGFQRFSMESSLYPGDDISTDTFVSIPSTMGSVFRINENIVAAFSAFVPKTMYISEMVVHMKSRHFYNFSIQDQTLWFGPSIGCSVSENLSVGASLFGAYRTYSSLQTYYFADHGLSNSRNLIFKNFSVMSILGAQYRINDLWRAGISLHTPSLDPKLVNSGEFEAHQVGVEDGHAYHDFAYSEDLYSRNSTPARVTTGVSYGKPDKYGLGLNVTYSDSMEYNVLEGTFIDGSEARLSTKLESVVDFSAGGEYYFFDMYPVRLGFFTSFSVAPEVKEDEEAFAQVDLYGVSFSVGRESKNVQAQIGLNYAFGSGTGHGYKTDEAGIEKSVVDMDESHLYLFFNTTYMF